MPNDRSNDAFGFGNVLWQWPGADTDLWDPLISGTQEWCSRCSSAIYALNRHWFEFLQKRAQEDFALPQHIMSCRTSVEVWSVYMQFLQQAVTDYQKEFVELGKLGIVVGSEPVTQKPKTSSAVDEFRRSAFHLEQPTEKASLLSRG